MVGTKDDRMTLWSGRQDEAKSEKLKLESCGSFPWNPKDFSLLWVFFTMQIYLSNVVCVTLSNCFHLKATLLIEHLDFGSRRGSGFVTHIPCLDLQVALR